MLLGDPAPILGFFHQILLPLTVKEESIVCKHFSIGLHQHQMREWTDLVRTQARIVPQELLAIFVDVNQYFPECSKALIERDAGR